MNRMELVKRLADKADIKQMQAGKILDCLVETITEVLCEGDKIILPGFGTFSVMERKARKGRNPKTGKEVKIAAKNVAKFKPGKTLRESL